MCYIDELNEKFPIRRSLEQKESFRAWFLQTARDLGYEARVEDGKHDNVIVGDPEAAEVVFTAHYDTPAAAFLPNLMTPRNRPLFFCYQMLLVLVLIAAACVVGVPVFLATGSDRAGLVAGYLVYMGGLFMMLFGPANKHNVNDNTSGVAAVLEIMSRLPQEKRGKAAFILFDNEEKGCCGSKAYAKAHPAIKADKLIVNMDCVGDGENILLVANKLTRETPAYEQLCAAMKEQQGRKLHLFPLESSVFNSDQKNFKRGIAVCACKDGKRIGFYTDKIHTARDLTCDQANLDFIAQGMAEFVGAL